MPAYPHDVWDIDWQIWGNTGSNTATSTLIGAALSSGTGGAARVGFFRKGLPVVFLVNSASPTANAGAWTISVTGGGTWTKTAVKVWNTDAGLSAGTRAAMPPLQTWAWYGYLNADVPAVLNAGNSPITVVLATITHAAVPNTELGFTVRAITLPGCILPPALGPTTRVQDPPGSRDQEVYIPTNGLTGLPSGNTGASYVRYTSTAYFSTAATGFWGTSDAEVPAEVALGQTPTNAAQMKGPIGSGSTVYPLSRTSMFTAYLSTMASAGVGPMPNSVQAAHHGHQAGALVSLDNPDFSTSTMTNWTTTAGGVVTRDLTIGNPDAGDSRRKYTSSSTSPYGALAQGPPSLKWTWGATGTGTLTGLGQGSLQPTPSTSTGGPPYRCMFWHMALVAGETVTVEFGPPSGTFATTTFTTVSAGSGGWVTTPSFTPTATFSTGAWSVRIKKTNTQVNTYWFDHFVVLNAPMNGLGFTEWSIMCERQNGVGPWQDRATFMI